MLRMAIGHTDITPQESVPLQGYGDRTHDSEGVHDPLYAYAWYCESPGDPPFVWVALDLCLMSVITARELAAALSATTAMPADRIFISTTHTHSGPVARFISRDTSPWAVRYYGMLRERLGELIQETRQRAFRGSIEVRTGASRIGVNRRDAAAPIDPRLVLFSLKDEGGTQRGLLFHYSCHLTVLGVDNYRVSADWAGPVRESLQKELSVPVMFLQGAEGNVDPASRGALDMADPDQAVGSSFDVVEQTARTMAGDIRAASATAPVATMDRLTARTLTVHLPLRYGALSPAQVQSKLDDWKEKLGRFLGIPEEKVPEGGIINAMVKDRARAGRLPPEETRRWVAEQFAYGAFVSIYKTGGELIDARRGEVECPLRLLDGGAVKLLGIPAEALLDVAFDWQARVPDAIALVAGLFGGWIGYLPHRANFEEPRASELYETVSSVFSPQAAEMLLDAVRQPPA